MINITCTSGCSDGSTGLRSRPLLAYEQDEGGIHIASTKVIYRSKMS